jgi:polyphosphate glucokinase
MTERDVPGARLPTILVVDVGGTSVKVRASDWADKVRIPSGPRMGPADMLPAVRAVVAGRRFDAVALGYPGPVVDGRPTREPHNLAAGWVGFDFAAAFGVPVRAMNDAAMQALGNYTGGRILFLGFGTGLGSAVVADGVVLPLELAHLPYRKGRTYEQYVGASGRRELGEARWRRHCHHVAALLRDALQVGDVVLGGGNARRLAPLPAGMRLGKRDAAFAGGLRLWADARIDESAPPPAGDSSG